MQKYPRRQSFKTYAKARSLAQAVPPQAQPCSIISPRLLLFPEGWHGPCHHRPCQVPNCLFSVLFDLKPVDFLV